MTNKSTYEREAVGVFKDRRTAELAAQAARDAGADRVRVGVDADRILALRAEMREEIDHTVIGPGPIGPFTKEAGRRIAWVLPAWTVGGAILLLPLAFLPLHMSLPVRLILAAVVGAAAGATIGLILGGGFGMKGPEEPLGAERGVIVSARTHDPAETERVTERMKELDPIRIDVATPQHDPTGTVATEEDVG